MSKVLESMKSKNSKNSNPFFTICIPTWNRGKRALSLVKRILPEMEDNWQILVLDNASYDERKFYKKISKLSDVNNKVRYIRHKKNGGFEGNYLACFEDATSDYIMMISDEDYPDMSGVKEVLPYFERNKDLGIIRGTILAEEGVMPCAAPLPNAFFKAGKEAISGYGLLNNYPSGTIYNRKIVIKNEFNKALRVKIVDQAAYPHLYLELFICSKSDVMTVNTVCAHQGPTQLTKTTKGDELGGHFRWRAPFSYGSRIDQFIVLRDALYEIVSIIDKNRDDLFFVTLYLGLVRKWFYLISQVNMPMYQKHKIHSELVKESFFAFACSAILVYPELKRHHKRIVDLIGEIYECNKIK